MSNSQRRVTDFSAANIAIIAALTFVTAVCSLHILRRETDIIDAGMSFYAVGPFGVIMTVAFTALAVSVIALVVAIVRLASGSSRPRVGLALLTLGGVALAVVALFPSDTVPPVSRGDFIHLAAAVTFFASFTVASLLISLRVSFGPSKSIILLLAVAGAVAFGVIVFGPRGIHGVLQRVTMAIQVAWVLAVAISLRRRSALEHVVA